MNHIRFSLLVTTVLLVSLISAGQSQKEIPLYPQGIANNPVKHNQKEAFVDSIAHPNSLSHLNRVYSYVSEPTCTLYPASKANNRHIGVVILPGGGLVNNWLDKEGTDLALWLSGQGINCMVLKYRTNTKDAKGQFIIPFDDYKGAVYQDARTSVLTFKAMADSLNIDRDKIGMIGFSAGGWLAERIAFKATDGTYDWEPAFVGLIYHGDNVKTFQKLKNRSTLPPFFMAVARNDHKLPMEKMIPFLTAIATEVKGSELHIYSKGKHGFGLAYDNGHSVELWKESFYNWLLDLYN